MRVLLLNGLSFPWFTFKLAMFFSTLIAYAKLPCSIVFSFYLKNIAIVWGRTEV